MFRYIWSFSRLIPYFSYSPKLLSYNHFSHAHPAKTQISLIIRSVWSIIVVRNKTEQTVWVIVIQNSDQAGGMSKLIPFIARHTYQFAGIIMRYLKHVPPRIEFLGIQPPGLL